MALELRTVDSRWAMTNTVRPSMRASIPFSMSFSVRVSMELVASSRIHRGVQPSIPDVVGDGSGKQVGVLDDQGEGFSQIVLFDASDVDAVIGDGAAGNLVEPVNQIDNGGLSGAGGADEGDFLSWFRVEADIVQHLLLRGIAKDHMVEPHIAF